MENVNLEYYKIFYYVAINQNLTKAAEYLSISQPAITQSIKRLENQIGYSLFFRTKQGMQLTDAGMILFEHLKYPLERILNSKETLDKALNKDSIVIRIGAGDTIVKDYLIDTIKIMTKKYPKLQFEIVDDSTKGFVNLMDEGLLDIAIFNAPINITIDHPIMIIEEIEYAFLTHKNLIKNKNKTYTLKEITELPFAIQKKSSNSRKFLDKLFNCNHTELKPTYELLTYSLVVDFVKNGLAIGFVNKTNFEKELKSKEIIELKTNSIIPKRRIELALNKRIKNNKIIEELIYCIKNRKD